MFKSPSKWRAFYFSGVDATGGYDRLQGINREVIMKRLAILAMAGIFAASAATAFADSRGGKVDGKKKFEEHCKVCHPNGGNIVNPKKTLGKADLEKSGIKRPEDIVKIIRNPGPGMTKIDAKTLSDKEALAVADYIMKTFK
jgi:cytochrome c6